MSLLKVNLQAKHVLVTGATGFIGGRLIERLVQHRGINVRALVRNFAHASRIGRFAVEMVPGEVTNARQVSEATDGCDVVFHCAYGSSGDSDEQRRVNVEGTRNVLEAALAHGVKRLVFLSTLMVYGASDNRDLDETAPRRYSGSPYSDTKIDAEKLVFEYFGRGLPVTVLQPTLVYGPYSPYGTVSILATLRSSKIILVNGGEGICNAVYVDDVVSAALLAATRNEAAGEAFLISGPKPVTWREYYAGYERLLNMSATVSMSAQEAICYYKEKSRPPGLIHETLNLLRCDPAVKDRIANTREMRLVISAARRLLPERLWRRMKGQDARPLGVSPFSASAIKPPAAWSPTMIRFFAARTPVRIDKARRLLGYEPAFTLDRGMRLTEQWARWANLLG